MPAASPETLARHLVDDPDALAPETLARTGDALAAGLAEARARWPGLRLDDHEFAAFVGARVDRTRPLDEVVDELHLVDLALALACLHGEGPAILAFESAVRGTLREVFGGVTSRGVDPEDLKQRLLQRLFVADGERPPRIADYTGRGPLRAWVKVAATRLRIDAERKRGDKAQALATDDDRLMALADGGDAELTFLKEQYRSEFKRAFQEALAALGPRERNLLRLTVVEGISATKIAQLFSVHRATAKRWLVSARAELLEGTRGRLIAALRVDPDELESIIRMIQSNLEVSMTRILDDE
ncbi:MAG: sigma-70 family RNA polymerase sigma factor [Myxococcales bacterium]|nr:sigma-70 family RNA polymerase sigma factor [Myxococcales bacterium]